MGVLLVCLVAVSLLQPTEGICNQETEFEIYDSDNPDAEEICRKCPKCQPGRGLAVQCGSRVPYGTFTGCKKCEVDKTYSENNDISDCKPCNQCGNKIVLQQCTPTQNSKCADTCIPGYKLHPIIDQCQLVVPVTTEPPIDSQVSKHVLAKILGGCLGGVAIMVYILICFIIVANERRRRSQSCEGLVIQQETNDGRTTPPLANHSHENSATASSTVNIDRTKPLLENRHTVSSAAFSMVNDSTTPLLLNQSSDSSATSSMVNCRTTPLLDNQSPESSAASSMESLDANNEETTGRDNLDLLRIPEGLFVSDMEKLHYNNQVMFHSVQKKLDARETLQKKTWRGVGMALGVSSDDLDLIETCYISQQSPAEALVLRLKNRSCGEPSMREFVRALIKCERGDVARIIIDWPRWEMTGDLVDSG